MEQKWNELDWRMQLVLMLTLGGLVGLVLSLILALIGL